MSITRYENTRDQRKFLPGYDVDPNSIRYSNYYHLLREIIHLYNGWLPRIPPFDAKCVFGTHVYEDALQVAAIKERLKELRHPSEYPAAPGDGLAGVLDELSALDTWQACATAIYKVLKPALVKAWRHHLETACPILDEPTTRLLNDFLRTTEKQIRIGFDLVDDIIAEGTEEAALVEETENVFSAMMDELGEFTTAEVNKGDKRVPKPFAPIDHPLRDEGISLTEFGDTSLPEQIYVNGAENYVPTEDDELRHYFHALLDAEVTAAEIIALNSHEYPKMPWRFHVDMARQTWDEIRHAQIFDRALQELGAEWGTQPLTFRFFKKIYKHDLLGRLILFNRQSEGNAMWRHNRRKQVLIEKGRHKIAQIFDYLLADEVAHVANGVNWGTYLLDGDRRAFIDKVKELTKDAGKVADEKENRKTAGARGFEQADDESEQMVETALTYLADD